MFIDGNVALTLGSQVPSPHPAIYKKILSHVDEIAGIASLVYIYK